MFMVGLLAVGIASIKADVTPAPQVHIPQDEAPHRDSTEWWYFSGHLRGFDPSGKPHAYGYEFTFFQFINPTQPLPTYVGHMAITDLTRSTFHYEQKVVAQPVPNEKNGFNLTIAPWHMKGRDGANSLAAGFSDGSYGFWLNQLSLQPVVLHGNGGLIPYGPFGTSYYYSWTNLWTFGTLLDHGTPVAVIGVSWMDHQWGNFLPNPGGWDWFSIQLTNGMQYMLYFIRNGQGQIAQVVATQVTNGIGRSLAPDSVSETALGSWTSPVSKITYPSGWTVTVPGGTLKVTPLLKDQELVVSAAAAGAYWEGDSSVSGDIDGQPVTGVSYVEINPVPVAGVTPP
jgi:predicted secreted hydrolase